MLQSLVDHCAFVQFRKVILNVNGILFSSSVTLITYSNKELALKLWFARLTNCGASFTAVMFTLKIPDFDYETVIEVYKNSNY